MQRHFVRRAIQHAADLLPARHLTLSMTPTTHTGRIACSLFSSSSSSSPPSASPVRSESNEKNPTNTRTATASPAKTLRAGGKQDVGKTRNDVQNVDQTGQVFGALGMSLNTPLTGTRSVIDALGPTTFTIGGVRVKGGVLIMPLFSTLWNVDTWDDLCPEAFTLVKLTLPKPDILILGCGATVLVSISNPTKC